jgi:hypothetical protein
MKDRGKNGGIWLSQNQYSPQMAADFREAFKRFASIRED